MSSSENQVDAAPVEVADMIRNKAAVSVKSVNINGFASWRVQWSAGPRTFVRWVGYINGVYACAEETKTEAANSLAWMSEHAAHHFVSA